MVINITTIYAAFFLDNNGAISHSVSLCNSPLINLNFLPGLLAGYNISVLNITEEAIALGLDYMDYGAIPTSEPEDANHIAIATINGIEALASWNFKHIVSINPIRKIHAINLKRNYQIIEIGSLELFGGAIYGNL